MCPLHDESVSQRLPPNRTYPAFCHSIGVENQESTKNPKPLQDCISSIPPSCTVCLVQCSGMTFCLLGGLSLAKRMALRVISPKLTALRKLKSDISASSKKSKGSSLPQKATERKLSLPNRVLPRMGRVVGRGGTPATLRRRCPLPLTTTIETLARQAYQLCISDRDFFQQGTTCYESSAD